MVLKTISPGCEVRASLMLFLYFEYARSSGAHICKGALSPSPDIFQNALKAINGFLYKVGLIR